MYPIVPVPSPVRSFRTLSKQIGSESNAANFNNSLYRLVKIPWLLDWMSANLGGFYLLVARDVTNSILFRRAGEVHGHGGWHLINFQAI